MNTQFLRDYYSLVKATLKQKYPNVTNNDLAFILGREAEVFDRVEQRTGIKREEVVRTVEQELHLASAA